MMSFMYILLNRVEYSISTLNDHHRLPVVPLVTSQGVGDNREFFEVWDIFRGHLLNMG